MWKQREKISLNMHRYIWNAEEDWIMRMILAFAGIFVAVFTRTFLAYRYKLVRAVVHGEDVSRTTDTQPHLSLHWPTDSSPQ